MASPPSSAPHLPVQLTSFVGRQREMEEVRTLLGTCRILTLTGAGGSGKTRLALEVARQLGSQAAGDTAWVELGSLADPELVPRQVAASLGIREEGAASSTAALLEVLRDRPALVVVDNCEHLVEAVARLVDVLLRECPRVTFLATSREPLGVEGERAWLVPPLSLPESRTTPSPAELQRSEAVQLFTLRARDALRTFALTEENAPAVVEICRRLDGLPLAVELAAARVPALSPHQIADRLDRAFDLLASGRRTALPRQRTLRATMDWSYSLLSTPEQLLLQRLAVFSGGFTLDAVEEVCAGGEIPAVDVLDLLASLVDRSLVAVRERDRLVRYELLETVRQYAEEKRNDRDSSGGPADLRRARQRHADHYLGLAEAAHPALEGYQGFNEWLPRLAAEQDNIRAALGWALEEEPTLAVRFVGHLPYFWTPQPVHWAEGLRWTEAALERAPEPVPAPDRARASWAAGLLSVLLQDWSGARRRIDEAVDLARASGDQRLLVLALGLSPLVAAMQDDPDLADVHSEEAVDLARRLGEPWLVAVALITGVAPARRAAGGLPAAEPALREALELAQREGFAWCIWECAIGLSAASLERGDPEEAYALATTAAAAADQLGADWHAARVVVVLATVFAAQGDPHLAGRLLGSVTSWLEAAGTLLFPAEEVLYQRLAAELTRSLGEEGLRRVLEEGRKIPLAEALRIRRGGAAHAVARPRAPAGQPPLRAVSPERDGSTVPWLEVAALGPLRITLDGHTLDPAAWIHAKPRELLLYLLAHPQGRTREQIGLAFWPEASAAQVKNSFHVLLHKLRKALEREKAIVLDGERYRVSPELDTWFDVEVFETKIRRALGEAGSGPPPAEALEEALALYRGDFMEGEVVGDWHLEVHGHARRLLVEGLSRLADLRIQAGELDSAARTLERLVQKEDLREEAYRRLMICHARLGRREEALRHHRRLVLLLRDELDAEPEQETEELATRIRDAAAV